MDGEKYLPTNTEGNSTFEIPVAALGTPLAVTADTVAMSKPHEIEYTPDFYLGVIFHEADPRSIFKGSARRRAGACRLHRRAHRTRRYGRADVLTTPTRWTMPRSLPPTAMQAALPC
ncbi:MAG: hypothetical protein ACLVJH_07435 [Faecalibacterium prausnitzii]